MIFPSNVSFPSTVSYPITAYYPGQFIPPNGTPTTYHPDTISWRDRSIAKSGIVDNIDLQAIDTFVEGVYDLGLRDSVGSDHTIIELMPLAGGNLASCLTKLWYLPNVRSSALNTNFVESDYSRATGLTGNGLDKYLVPVLDLAEQGVTDSLALGVYNRTSGGFDCVEIGVEFEFPNRLFLQVQYSDNIASFDCFDYASGRCGVDLTNKDCTGFILGSRLSSTDSRLYRNGNQLAAINTSGGTIPYGPLIYYRANGPYHRTNSPRSLGLIMVCRRGIEPAKVAPLNTLVHNLMSAFGRAIEITSPTPVPVPTPVPSNTGQLQVEDTLYCLLVGAEFTSEPFESN